MRRLYIVNGTGVSDNAAYLAEFRQSFLYRVKMEYASQVGCYERGPNMLDINVRGMANSTTSQLAETVVKAVRSDLAAGKLGPGGAVFMGYSRGGAAVIAAAQRLQQLEPSFVVQDMFLLDPVDRSAGVDTTVIPSSVRTVHRVLRTHNYYGDIARRHLRETLIHPSDPRYAKLPPLPMPMPVGPGVMMMPPPRLPRNAEADQLVAQELMAAGRDDEVISSDSSLLGVDFGNTGNRHFAKSTRFAYNVAYPGSHGAMGGVPWKFRYATKYQHLEDLAVAMLENQFLPRVHTALRDRSGDRALAPGRAYA